MVEPQISSTVAQPPSNGSRRSPEKPVVGAAAGRSSGLYQAKGSGTDPVKELRSRKGTVKPIWLFLKIGGGDLKSQLLGVCIRAPNV